MPHESTARINFIICELRQAILHIWVLWIFTYLITFSSFSMIISRNSKDTVSEAKYINTTAHMIWKEIKSANINKSWISFKDKQILFNFIRWILGGVYLEAIEWAERCLSSCYGVAGYQYFDVDSGVREIWSMSIRFLISWFLYCLYYNNYSLELVTQVWEGYSV